MLPPAQATILVAQGDADIAITFAMSPAEGTDVLYDGTVEMIALAAPDHPLAKAPEIALSDMPNYPLALPTRDTTVRLVFDAACQAEGIVVEPVLTANVLSALLPFVRRSRGFALMSALPVQTPLRLNEIVSLPIRSRLSLTRRIQIQSMRGRRLPRQSDPDAGPHGMDREPGLRTELGLPLAHVAGLLPRQALGLGRCVGSLQLRHGPPARVPVAARALQRHRQGVPLGSSPLGHR